MTKKSAEMFPETMSGLFWVIGSAFHSTTERKTSEVSHRKVRRRLFCDWVNGRFNELGAGLSIKQVVSFSET